MFQLRIFRSEGDSASGKHNERLACSLSRNRATPCRGAFRVKTAEYSCLDIVKPHFRHYHYVKHVVEADKSNNGCALAPNGTRVSDFSTLVLCSRSNSSLSLPTAISHLVFSVFPFLHTFVRSFISFFPSSFFYLLRYTFLLSLGLNSRLAIDKPRREVADEDDARLKRVAF